MHSKDTDAGTTPELVAEMRAIIDETRRAIETSQAILDRCTEREADAGAGPDEAGLLGAISEGLIHAYRFAKRDGDPMTIGLVEEALFHVGRRLARGMSPGDMGLACH